MPSSALISMVTQSLRLSRHGSLLLLLFIFRIHKFLRFWGKIIVCMYFDTLLHQRDMSKQVFVLTPSYRGSKNTRKVYDANRSQVMHEFIEQ